MEETKLQGPWLRSGRTIYALVGTGRFRKGKEEVSNRFFFGVQKGHGCTDEEADAIASVAHAAPEMLAYAQAEENAHTLWQMGVDCYAKKIPPADYWAAVDRLFPEIASKCPEPTEEAARAWFEAEFTTTLDARHSLYGPDADISGDEGSFCSLLHEHLMALRAAALAKALGRTS